MNKAAPKIRGPETWAMIRHQYLSGTSARVLAIRYDVTVANIRRRAEHENWTRRAHAKANDIAPTETVGLTLVEQETVAEAIASAVTAALAPVEAVPDTPIAASDAFARATTAAMRALAAGRLAEAAQAAKVAEIFGRLAGVGGERGSEPVFIPSGPDVFELLRREFGPGAEGAE
jgi:hypothetical protein